MNYDNRTDNQPFLQLDYQQSNAPQYAQGAGQPGGYAQAGPVSAQAPTGANGYKDIFWAIAFVIHLLVFIVVSLFCIFKYNSETKDKTSTDSDSVQISGQTYGCLILVMLASLFICLLWLAIIRAYAYILIYVALWSLVGVFGLAAVVCLLGGALPGTVIFAILAGIIGFTIYWIRDRIALAAKIMVVACNCIRLWPATILVAVVGVILQAFWLSFWSAGAIATFYVATASTVNTTANSTVNSTRLFNAATLTVLDLNSTVTTAAANSINMMALTDLTDADTDNGYSETLTPFGYIVLFLLFLSLYWTSQVIKNVVHVTVAGVMGTWYFLYPNAMPANPTSGALKRALSTSFGSICFGSFILAFIRALRAVVNIARNQNPTAEQRGNPAVLILRQIAFCLLACILRCLDRIVEYINQYAYAQIALYGKSYLVAANDTIQLFKSRGFDAILNDSLTGLALTFAALMAGILSGIVGGVLAATIFPDAGSWIIFALFGGIIGFAMTMIAVECVESAVICFFVCLAEDPAALYQNKPEIYNDIVPALQAQYPTAVFAMM